MTVKLNSLARWASLDRDKAIVFAGSDVAERRVRINFNLEAVTAFYIDLDGEEAFLATMQPGLDTLEFNAPGTFRVYAESGSGVVQYQSADLEPTFAEVVDPVIFTRIANRRHRNPELEEMMYRMQLNADRRAAQQVDEVTAAFERRIREMENGRSAETVISAAPGASSASGGAQVPAEGAGGEKPGEAPASGAGGEQQGGAGGGQAGGNPPA